MSDVRVRRPPPPFRTLTVRRTESLTPHMRRIVLGGPELEGLVIDAPAASVRLFVPPDASGDIELPTWTGNQFEHAGGQRAPIRTMTPRHLDTDRLELTIDVVLHDHGVATDWARAAEPGHRGAISGPARGFELDPAARTLLLAGDESAIPAIAQLLEWVPGHVAITAHIEIRDRSARLPLPEHPGATVAWHEPIAGAPPGTACVDAIETLDPLPDALWIAGEAAAVQRARKYVFDVRDVPRSRVSAHGYWKHGRSAS